MPSPLIRHRERPALMAPQYLGSIQYYACLASYQRVVIDLDMRYDKRFKSTHRCVIADTRGPLQLTVPVEKVTAPATWASVGVSSHGQWWSDHTISLESAYGRTPFFEFYFDRFRPWIARRAISVSELDRQLDAIIRSILSLDSEVAYATGDEEYDDFRSCSFPCIADVPYYQVRQDKLGFIPGMSILDLIFNMGPEAPLVLLKMAANA